MDSKSSSVTETRGGREGGTGGGRTKVFNQQERTWRDFVQKRIPPGVLSAKGKDGESRCQNFPGGKK